MTEPAYVGFKDDPEVVKDLDRHAAQTDRSRSAVIRLAIRHYLKDVVGEEPQASAQTMRSPGRVLA